MPCLNLPGLFPDRRRDFARALHDFTERWRKTKAAAAATDKASEQVIITEMAAQQSRVRAFLSRLLGKGKGEKATGSEVLSVPKERSAWLIKRLEALGCKVVKLRENWQHLLGRPKGPTDLTPAQQEVIKKATTAPETVHVGVLNMPDAAIAELALTRFEKLVGTKGQAGPPQDRYAKVVLPLDATRDVTLVRTRPR